ncbi:hypothetical protein F66182_379 [Fusarium sp. NRRL 66182]|nr:hypothetical protein F66182_379 [Fusarium sp. NRRL 66182]
MSSLLGYLPFFKSDKQRLLPEMVESDDIIPVHLFDDSAAARGIVLVWTFTFDDVLNPHKLRDALASLFQMDGWRRFSGRFRYRPDGSLEVHVPSQYSEDRPAVLFTHEHHGSSMTDHPLASKLPQPTGKIATYPGPKEFCSLGLGPDMPRNIDDFVYSGHPQFCLHVQTFTDGTLVSLTHSHISTDLMGLASILEAWSLVLAGRPDAVAPMTGYHQDVFDNMWNPPPMQRHVLADKILDGWRFRYWGLRSLYESWRYSDVQSRTMCIPGHVMDKMMQEARSHLDAQAQTHAEPFISEGDVLTAVACRMLAKYQGRWSSRELATILAVDPRSRAKSVFSPGVAYVQNAPTNIYLFCSANEALSLPLGKLAHRVREAIETQTTEEQLKAATFLSAESMKQSKMPVIFGDMNMAAQFMSNWTKGRLADRLDFSPAIEQDTEHKARRGKRGHPVYYQASDPSHNTVSVISSVFVVVGKDYDGNTWFSNSLPTQMWSDLIEYVEQFS